MKTIHNYEQKEYQQEENDRENVQMHFRAHSIFPCLINLRL